MRIGSIGRWTTLVLCLFALPAWAAEGLVDSWVLKSGYPRFTDKYNGALAKSHALDLQAGTLTVRGRSEQLKTEVTHRLTFTPLPRRFACAGGLKLRLDATGTRHECADFMVFVSISECRGREELGKLSVESDLGKPMVDAGWVTESEFRTEFDVPELTFYLAGGTTLDALAEWKYERKKIDPSRMSDAATSTARVENLHLVAYNSDMANMRHEFAHPEEGMTRLPNTAYPDFFCHDFAFRPEHLRFEPVDPADPLYDPLFYHLSADPVLANPGRYGFVEINNRDDARPGDVVVYMNDPAEPGKGYHSALVVRNEGTGWAAIVLHSKDDRNSVFEHRLGGSPNYFMETYGRHGVRIFRRGVK